MTDHERARTVAPARQDRPAPPAALYVHVPFCVSLCPYCDFVVLAGAAARGPRSRVAEYVSALLAEIDLRADALVARHGPPGTPARPPLGSVYLGGGTPSLLPVAALDAILGRVRDRFGIALGAEVTLEVNPGPDERGDLPAVVAAGITRLSVGAQSLDPAELSRIGRRHGPGDVRATVEAARDAGLRSVSLDLLYDIPGQALVTWRATLAAALALGPDHLSLYALTLDDPDAEGLTGPLGDHLPTSSGARHWRVGARTAQDEDTAAACYEAACEILADAGFRGYEISNWALPGHESRHNLAYWERRPHEAVGLGAHAFDGRERRWNAARLDGYLAALIPAGDGGARLARAGRGRGDAADPRTDGATTSPVAAMGPVLPPGGAELVDDATAVAEELVLGLRLDRGVPASMAADPRFAEAFAWARDADLVEDAASEPGSGPDSSRRIRLTVRGRLLSNELFARLM